MLANKAEFEELFRAEYGSLASYANRILQDADSAEDITQQVFIHLWEKRSEIEIKGSPKSYLMRSVHNACLNHLKHLKVVKDHQTEILASEERASQLDPLESAENQTIIKNAVKSLPPQCRKVFLMSRIQNKKYKEIAEELDISVKTVENQMGKALKDLRTALSSEKSKLISIVKTFLWLLIGVKSLSVVLE